MGLLVDRNVAWLWVGQMVSSVGDFAFSTTVVLWIATRLAAGQPWARWRSAVSFSRSPRR